MPVQPFVEDRTGMDVLGHLADQGLERGTIIGTDVRARVA
jgi:hypothetical protein